MNIRFFYAIYKKHFELEVLLSLFGSRQARKQVSYKFCAAVMESQYYTFLRNRLSTKTVLGKHGCVFYEKAMGNQDVLAKVVAEQKDLLADLLKANPNPKRLDLQKALTRWSCNHVVKIDSSEENIFNLKDSEADSHPRNQAGGIKMMISYLSRTKRNIKDGSKIPPEVRDLVALLPKDGRAPSPSPPKEDKPKPATKKKSSASVEDIMAHFGSAENTKAEPELVDLVSSPEAATPKRKRRRQKSTDFELPAPELTTEEVQEKPEMKFVYKTDWTAKQMVRMYENGAVRPAAEVKTVPGKAFNVAVFEDGITKETCTCYMR